MNAHQRIKARRLELGLSESAVAQRIGIGIDAYCDVEQHADEFFTVVNLETARALCRVLDLDLEELVGFVTKGAIGISDVSERKSRHELIRCGREAAGLSRAAVAEHLGFDEETIEDWESDPNAVDRYPIELLVELADLLRLAPLDLLRPM